MKIFRIGILSLLLIAVFLTGCTSTAEVLPTPIATIALPSPTAAETAIPPILLTDGLGTEVSLPKPAARIVSLGASNTEILFAIGAGDLLFGCDQFSDYPEEAKPLATISAGYGTLDVESIKALEPDLVLAAEIISAEQVQAMRSLGLTVFYAANPASLPEGLFDNIRTVGTLTGRAAQAEDLIALQQTRFRSVTEKTGAVSSTPLVFFELDGTDPARPFTAGPGTFIDMLIDLAGGRNLGATLTSGWAQISAEEIFRQDPELILLGDTAFGVTPGSLADRPGWQNLAAVKNGAVYAIDSNLVLRPGPRLIDGLERMASFIHPELFPGTS